MTLNDVLQRMADIAAHPEREKERYLREGRKIVLTAPVYTPEEIIHSMGLVPMGAWGADVRLARAKAYFPAFICSVAQSIVELGMAGTYAGASAIVIPSLCDSLKVLGQNWKYAVPEIPFIPMTYPQNRKPAFGAAYTLAGYRRVIAELEKATGAVFSEEKLAESIAVYNRHNAAMRRAAALLAEHPEVTAAQRSDVFKSAFFVRKEEHTALVKALCGALAQREPAAEGLRVVVSGILADSPALNAIFDENGLHITADDVAAQSRQYRTDAPESGGALGALAAKFCAMDACSVLYDAEKTRVGAIVDMARKTGARGVIVVLTKFCDPEEFDWPLIKKACDEAGLACIQIETDRQMDEYGQARTAVETFCDMLRA